MAGERAQAPTDRFGGVGRFDGGGRADNGPGQEERPPDLFVRGDGDGGEALRHGQLRGGEEEAGLADPRLTLDRDPGQPSSPGHPQLLLDRRQLEGTPDHGAGDPLELEGQWRQRLEDRGERRRIQSCRCRRGERGRLGREARFHEPLP